VLHEACQQVVHWRDSDLVPESRFTLGVNLSAGQLADEYLVPRIADIVARTGLDPSWLTLEITKTALIGDLDRSAERLKALRTLGVSIVVDDYGTGYGSLSYARRLPTDTLKIDKSFVRGFGSDHRDTAIVTSVITLAHLLNQTTVAKGVETPAQLQILRALGCDHAQGYLFAPRPSLSRAGASLNATRAHPPRSSPASTHLLTSPQHRTVKDRLGNLGHPRLPD
jgi:EAL domain-containing protein (putative c-di-GMP-specific phosphodiesterase class I)